MENVGDAFISPKDAATKSTEDIPILTISTLEPNIAVEKPTDDAPAADVENNTAKDPAPISDSFPVKDASPVEVPDNAASGVVDSTLLPRLEGNVLFPHLRRKNYRHSSARPCTSVQLPPSGLSGQITATSTVKNILPSPFSATATKKSLQNISVEKQDISLKDGKKHDIPSLRLSGITKSNIKISNFTMQKETRPVRFIERKQEVPLYTVSRISSSASAKKFALPSPSLKRKMLEESKTDPESLNPLKRVMESTTQRRGSLEVSPTINKKLEVSSTFDKNMVLGTGNPEAHQGSVSMDSIAYSSYVPEMKNVADIELPVLIENDGNVEKAEACAKELDDICNMLRKKNEEAKELLVRSVVNNNALMMLNHPMYDEKIRALQKRFASLQSREL